MTDKKTLAITGIASFVAMSMLSQHAYANNSLNDNKVVRDTYNNPVHNYAFGTCVRTNWETADGKDPCAVEVVQAEPVPVPSPARTLKKGDRTLYFEFDSAELQPEEKKRLDEAARRLKASADVRHVDIVGYADTIGNPNYNLELSKKRAKAVQDYLTSQGYINTRIADTRGLGETDAYADCRHLTVRSERIACLQPNRRVEVEAVFLPNEAYSRNSTTTNGRNLPDTRSQKPYTEPDRPYGNQHYTQPSYQQ